MRLLGRGFNQAATRLWRIQAFETGSDHAVRTMPAAGRRVSGIRCRQRECACRRSREPRRRTQIIQQGFGRLRIPASGARDRADVLLACADRVEVGQNIVALPIAWQRMRDDEPHACLAAEVVEFFEVTPAIAAMATADSVIGFRQTGLCRIGAHAGCRSVVDVDGITRLAGRLPLLQPRALRTSRGILDGRERGVRALRQTAGRLATRGWTCTSNPRTLVYQTRARPVRRQGPAARQTRPRRSTFLNIAYARFNRRVRLAIKRGRALPPNNGIGRCPGAR